MSNRRIFTLRSEPTSARRPKETVKQSDIQCLKVRKQQLLEERKLLKAKIAHLTTPGATVPPGAGGERVVKQMEQKYRSLSKQVARQNTEIEDLLRSDAAVERQELVEEGKILYQEILRIEEEKEELNKITREINDEYQALLQANGQKRCKKQNERILELKAMIRKCEEENRVLENKIDRAKQDGNSEFIQNDDIRQEIEETRAKTKDVERRIKESTKSHKETMERLKASFDARGIDSSQIRS